MADFNPPVPYAQAQLERPMVLPPGMVQLDVGGGPSMSFELGPLARTLIGPDFRLAASAAPIERLELGLETVELGWLSLGEGLDASARWSARDGERWDFAPRLVLRLGVFDGRPLPLPMARGARIDLTQRFVVGDVAWIEVGDRLFDLHFSPFALRPELGWLTNQVSLTGAVGLQLGPALVVAVRDVSAGVAWSANQGVFRPGLRPQAQVQWSPGARGRTDLSLGARWPAPLRTGFVTFDVGLTLEHRFQVGRSPTSPATGG